MFTKDFISLKKKILVLSSTFPRWENDHEPAFVYELSRRFTENFDVYVLAPHTANSKEFETYGNIKVHRFRYAPENFEKLAYNGGIANNLKIQPIKYLLVLPFLIAEFIAANKLIRNHDIDLVHAHWLIPQGLVAVLLKKLTSRDIKTLVTAHGSDIFSFNGIITRQIKKFVLNNCENLTVVSHSMKTAVNKMNCTCHVDILPMGTDLTKRFVPDEKKQKPKQIIFVGRLIAQKGVNYLLDAFRKVIEIHPDATLQVIGYGPELESLKAQSVGLGIQKSVRFTGGIPQNDITPYLQSSSIAVFPYCRNKQNGEEGFGLVLVEALGCGCAVIASRQSSINEIIKDQQTGLLIDESNPQAISSAIVKLLENPELKNTLAKSGRDEILKLFDWNIISQSYVSLINRILSN